MFSVNLLIIYTQRLGMVRFAFLCAFCRQIPHCQQESFGMHFVSLLQHNLPLQYSLDHLFGRLSALSILIRWMNIVRYECLTPNSRLVRHTRGLSGVHIRLLGGLDLASDYCTRLRLCSLDDRVKTNISACSITIHLNQPQSQDEDDRATTKSLGDTSQLMPKENSSQ